jgi:molybdopterin/thiamine biosynthesis adenylyltransferase
MVILSRSDIEQTLLAAKNGDRRATFPLFSVDGGDGFVSADLVPHQRDHHAKAAGMLQLSDPSLSGTNPEIPEPIDVLVEATFKPSANVGSSVQDSYEFKAWIKEGQNINVRTVEVIELDEEIFSRVRGLYETDVLRDKRVLIVGVGSGGSAIALELAKAGVGNFVLVDHQRLEVANIVRHACGFSDLGRFKTKAVRDQILEKNPRAQVETFEIECGWNWLPNLKALMERANLVFCCTDNRPSKIIVNLASVSTKRVCVYGGTFNRAYGGHALRVIPGQTMCYQCFIDLLPEKAEDQEIATEEQANRIAYDDRQVPVEPGLANDIAPMSNMCVKLGLLELLRGTKTTLATLYEDLSNAWYQWLNRREADTEYAELPPMDTGDGNAPRILAWYGIANERNAGCPACGNFIAHSINGNVPTSAQIDAFANHNGDIAHIEESFPPVD